MKVKVYAPVFLNLKSIDSDGYVTLDEGATVNTLYKKLRIPLIIRPLMFCSVNYKQVKLKTKLKEGDIVSFLSFVSGG